MSFFRTVGRTTRTVQEALVVDAPDSVIHAWDEIVAGYNERDAEIAAEKSAKVTTKVEAPINTVLVAA